MIIDTIFCYFALLSAATINAYDDEKYARRSLQYKKNKDLSMSMTLNVWDENTQEVDHISDIKPINTDIVPSDSLNNQLICGYQGWYAYPGDGAPINRWKHWFSGQPVGEIQPSISDVMIDMLPTEDEYHPDDLKRTGLALGGLIRSYVELLLIRDR